MVSPIQIPVGETYVGSANLGGPDSSYGKKKFYDVFA